MPTQRQWTVARELFLLAAMVAAATAILRNYPAAESRPLIVEAVAAYSALRAVVLLVGWLASTASKHGLEVEAGVVTALAAGGAFVAFPKDWRPIAFSLAEPVLGTEYSTIAAKMLLTARDYLLRSLYLGEWAAAVCIALFVVALPLRLLGLLGGRRAAA